MKKFIAILAIIIGCVSCCEKIPMPTEKTITLKEDTNFYGDYITFSYDYEEVEDKTVFYLQLGKEVRIKNVNINNGEHYFDKLESKNFNINKPTEIGRVDGKYNVEKVDVTYEYKE